MLNKLNMCIFTHRTQVVESVALCDLVCQLPPACAIAAAVPLDDDVELVGDDVGGGGAG